MTVTTTDPYAVSVYHLRVAARIVRDVAARAPHLEPGLRAELERDAAKFVEIARSQREIERILDEGVGER